MNESQFYKILNHVSNFSAQASTGKQGVLGPTKIYLAVQPTGAETVTEPSSQPPPLAPVQQAITQPSPVLASNQIQQLAQSSPVQTGVTGTTVVQQVCNMIPKPKVVVQPVNQVLYT